MQAQVGVCIVPHSAGHSATGPRAGPFAVMVGTALTKWRQRSRQNRLASLLKGPISPFSVQKQVHSGGPTFYGRSSLYER